MSLQVQDTIRISNKGPASITAREVHGGAKKWNANHLPNGTQEGFSKRIVPYLHKKFGCSTKPWAPLTIDDVQEAVNLKFGLGQYFIAEKGAWMSLVSCYELPYLF